MPLVLAKFGLLASIRNSFRLRAYITHDWQPGQKVLKNSLFYYTVNSLVISLSVKEMKTGNEMENKILDSIYIPYKLRSWHLVPSLHGKQKEKKWKKSLTLFSWSPKLLWMVISAVKLKDACSSEGKL